LDLRQVEVQYNSKWLKKLKFKDTLALADLFTASQMIERRNFKDRWEKEQEISLREFLYPLMQGYDSVAVKADVELGGTDQLFNLLAGRKVQQHYGQKPQDVFMTAMLDGTDGRKMSTSWGNVINIADEPEEQYGKVMAARDEVIIQYFKLATDVPLEEVGEHERSLAAGANPKDIKQALALAIVKRYNGEKAAAKAAENWEKMFSKKDIENAEIPELKISSQPKDILELVMDSGVVASKSEARRLISQGAVSVNGESRKDVNADLNLKNGDTIKIGKKNFFRIKL
jgi:tyrosyl-tRNA synthetase